MARSVVLSVALVSVLGASGCMVLGWDKPKVWVEEERTFQFASAGIDRVDLRTHNGGITCIAPEAGSSQIEVVATLRAGGEDEADARACLEAIELLVTDGSGVIRGRYQMPKERGRYWGAVVSFQVSQPAAVAVEAETHNGPIRIEGIAADCSLETHNGEIIARDGSGEIEARTHNGGIEVEGAHPVIEAETHNGAISAQSTYDGPLRGDIETHNGSVRLQLSESATVHVVCRTHNGSIRTTGEFRDVSRGKRSLSARHGTGADAGEVKITTHNGSIRITERELLQ